MPSAAAVIERTRVLPQSALPWWCVVQVDAGAEASTAARLREREFDTRLPMCEETRRHARQTRTVTTALFPGYLFARVVPQVNAWWEAMGVRGVIRVVGDGRMPWPMPAAAMERIERRMAETIVIKPLEPGDRIRIEGATIGMPNVDELDGVFQEPVGAERVRILLDSLGKSMRLTVRKTQVWVP